mgnify:CR=1 FL=1
MTVKELSDALELKVFYMEEEDREIEGGYCGDLLSWVMGDDHVQPKRGGGGGTL